MGASPKSAYVDVPEIRAATIDEIDKPKTSRQERTGRENIYRVTDVICFNSAVNPKRVRGQGIGSQIITLNEKRQ